MDENYVIAISKNSNKNSAYPFRIGQNVSHAKFGNGVVICYEGNAANLVIKVNFGSNGLKSLAMEYAKLTAS